MAQSQLDYAQCLKSAFIDESEMLRTGSVFALEVNVLANATTGAITESITNCDGVTKINVHTLVGSSNLSTAAAGKIQYSPSDEDNIWIDSGLTITSTTGSTSVTSGTLLTTLLARRIRLFLTTAPSGGDVTFYTLGS